jgi:hypothetical protein
LFITQTDPSPLRYAVTSLAGAGHPASDYSCPHFRLRPASVFAKLRRDVSARQDVLPDKFALHGGVNNYNLAL